ncbi:hypothetical protein DB347_17675 [Opitutaceae bacterium EW11]|nr:hypothetical protein DB347_17675 [Opitutaceae bacterium EW11]
MGALAGCQVVPSDPSLTDRINFANGRLATYDLELSENAYRADREMGIRGRYYFRGAWQPDVVLPLPRPVQHIALIDGVPTAVPFAPAYGGRRTPQVLVVGRTAPADVPELAQIRSDMGGVFPYVVVNSKFPYLVLNQEGDVVILGYRVPRQIVASAGNHMALIDKDGEAIAGRTSTSKPRETKRTYENPHVKLPPGVPEDALEEVQLWAYSGAPAESGWVPNRDRCALVAAGAQTQSGAVVDVYQLVDP